MAIGDKRIKEASYLSSNKNWFTYSLNINGINISGNERMSKEFNLHFTNIAANIKDSINPTDKPPESYLNECRSSFQMPNITPEINYSIVKDFEDKKSVDLYGISPFLIKRIISNIANVFVIQGGPKKSLWCDLEEKCLWNSKMFSDGVVLYIFSHLLKKLELSKLFRKEIIGL